MALAPITPVFTSAEKNFFITEALIGLDSVNNKMMYVTEEKSDRYTFPRLDANPLLQPRQLLPVDGGTTTLTDRNFALGTFEAFEIFDPKVFENHWHKDQLSKLLLDRQLPVTFENYLASYYTNKIFTRVETMIHTGSLGYTTSVGTLGAPGVNFSNRYFDGIIRQAITGGAIQVASPSAITSGNIIAKMEAAKNAIPRALLSKANRYQRLKYIMSVEDAQLYEEALVSTSFKNQNTTERGLNQYKGYEILICAGIPKDTFYFCEIGMNPESNLHLVTNAMGDMNFILEKYRPESDAIFYKTSMKMGVGIAKPAEFVIHTTLVAGSFTA